jgi:hypothetical protein
MTPTDALTQAADRILADALAFHDRAMLDLDDLEAWGKEPVLDDTG